MPYVMNRKFRFVRKNLANAFIHFSIARFYIKEHQASINHSHKSFLDCLSPRLQHNRNSFESDSFGANVLDAKHIRRFHSEKFMGNLSVTYLNYLYEIYFEYAF